VELLDSAGASVAVSARVELHGQPRNPPVHADDDVDAVAAAILGLGRTYLQQQVPNPFFGQITDPRSLLSGPTVQRFRLLRPMPHFDGASVGTAEPARGDSNYHGMQAKWEKRFSGGLTALTHYTWSKMIDNASHSFGQRVLAGRFVEHSEHLGSCAASGRCLRTTLLIAR
jgi:hypothetical protein